MKLYEMHVDPDILERVLVVLAKSDGTTIVHAEEDGHGRMKYYRVYYECIPSVRKTLMVRCENAGLKGKIIWDPKDGDEWTLW